MSGTTDMRLLIAFLLTIALASAQDGGSAFEAASVKVNHSGPEAPNGFFPSPGRLRATNSTLSQLIQAAYNIKTGMLFGTRGWMESDRFDIDAKAAGGSTFDEDMVMLRTLLADRFQLKFHRETRSIKVRVLVLARGGLRIRASKDQDQKERVEIRPTEISGSAIPFGHFVTILEAQSGYPVVNETGLSGKYDLTLRYVRDDSSSVDGQSLFAALADLGLKLEARQTRAEVFVIESAERPGVN
jgi:uncharacterized protein (TIGR03435 family)